jgi:O-antigen ligase
MTAIIATLVFAVLISVLLLFTRDRGIKVSAAVWLTFAWLWFASSRNPSQWLNPHGIARQASDAYDEGNAFDRNILIAIMLVGVIVLAKRSERTTAFLAANFPVILLFLYFGLSATWSEHGDVSIRRWFRSLGDLLMVMVILTDVDWVSAFKRVYVRLACLLVPLSILFFRFYPELGRSYNIHDGRVSMTGVTDDKNALGMICMIFALAVAWAMLNALRAEGKRKRKLLVGYGLVLAMAVYINVVAGSATATACLIEGAGVMILTSRSSISRHPILTHLIVAAILGLTALNLFAGATLLAMLGRNSTLTGRTDLWNLSLTLVTNPLLGAGYESFWLGWRLQKMWTYITGVNQAHNGYLEIYLNLGWVGVGLLVSLLMSGYRNIIRAIRRQEPAGNLRLAYFVVACVYNCTEAGFKMMHPMWIIFLFVSTARPALRFTGERLAKYREAVGKSDQTPEFVNSSAGKQA